MNISFMRRFVVLASVVFFSIPAHSSPLSEKRMRFLMRELTISATRQQRALDEIALSGNEAVKYLPAYFDDRRRIANFQVLFLNTFPGAFEKYFETGATTVDEVAMQYFCWRTLRCVPTLDSDALQRICRKFSSSANACINQRQAR